MTVVVYQQKERVILALSEVRKGHSASRGCGTKIGFWLLLMRFCLIVGRLFEVCKKGRSGFGKQNFEKV
jgi:hypothetical protein